MSTIELENIHLRYPIYGAGARSLKRDIVNFFSRGKYDYENRITYIDALNGLSFSLQSGDYLGLIGHNGAGKSTLLRVLSGIYEPAQGRLSINGTVSALLGSTVGMQPELSGYENIKINSIVKGYSKEQTKQIIADIEEFTELGKFLQIPVKTYSAGMQARLAFAITTAIQPDILLLDEVVGAGDARFIHKARERMNQLMNKANIILLASHSTDIIKQFCNKLLWLDQGEVKMFGSDIDGILSAYLNH